MLRGSGQKTRLLAPFPDELSLRGSGQGVPGSQAGVSGAQGSKLRGHGQATARFSGVQGRKRREFTCNFAALAGANL